MKSLNRWSLVVVAWYQLASAAEGQQLGGAQSVDISLWRVLAALLLCIALVIGAAFALRYRMTGRIDLSLGTMASTKRIVLLERLRLGAQAELCLVTIDGQEWLVTATPTNVQLVVHTRDTQCVEEAVSCT